MKFSIRIIYSDFKHGYSIIFSYFTNLWVSNVFFASLLLEKKNIHSDITYL